MKKQIVSVLLLLAACREQRPPVPTTAENQQLNEMEDALNAMGNEEGPEQRPGPSNTTD